MATRGSSKHRPGFHILLLTIGFIVGGALTGVARQFLPAGAAKSFLTAAATPRFGPLQFDLVMVNFTVGFAFDVSLLGLLGILVAYLIARSLF